MVLLRKIEQLIRAEPILFALLLLAFFLRVVGVGYGLPLTVVNDEYPFTFAALQMLDTKTLIPALNPDAFANILPYPPYLSYALLLPFIVIIGVQILLWGGPQDLFTAHLLSDLSAFFIAARLLHVVLSVASVYLLYRVAEALFRSRIAAAAAGFLLATSILHVALSMVGRNWLPISFVFLLALYVLTRTWSLKKRYVLVAIIAGFGMGVSSLSLLVVALAALYYVLFDMNVWRDVPRNFYTFALCGMVFVSLAIIPALLWQGGNAFLGATTLLEEKSLAGFLTAPFSALSLTVFSEPVLTLLFLYGLVFLFVRERRVLSFVLVFFLVYVVIFYTFFRLDARFLLPLLPLYALCGGYVISRLWNRKAAVIICLVLIMPLAASARLAYLAFQGDTREHAREWVLEHLGPSDRVLVFSSSLHIPTQSEAVDELRSIDPGALRKVDEADEILKRQDVPYALNNLTSLVGTPFMRDIAPYARTHGYMYAIVEPRSLEGTPETAEIFASLTKDADVVAHFSGFEMAISIWESAFLKPFPNIFADKTLGPDIVIYRLAVD